MGRRRPGVLFEDDRSSTQEPEDAMSPAPVQSAPTEVSEEQPAASAQPIVQPPQKKKKPRPKVDEERTLRDRVRERAAKKQFSRIKFMEDVVEGKRTPTKFQMDALLALNELAIDKTPTAQPVTSNRKRVLTGFVGTVPGRYPGGSSVVKPPVATTVAPPPQTPAPEPAANG